MLWHNWVVNYLLQILKCVDIKVWTPFALIIAYYASALSQEICLLDQM